MEEELIEEALIEETVIENPLDAVSSEVAQQTQQLLRLDDIKNLFTWSNAAKLGVALVTLLVLFGIYRFLKRLVNKRFASKLQAHTKLLLNKAITYVFYILVGMYVLSCFGVNLSAVWGAAGVAGLAIGFAAQTSVSNIISGLFVLSEKALRVGDFIEVDGVSGVVDSIDLLSVMVHTLDNQMIRIPNSTIINDTFKNYSHFPIRRMMFDIPLSYKTDLEKALEALKRVPAMCPSALTDPPPVFYYDSFGPSVVLKLGVWIDRNNFLASKTEVIVAVSKVCKEEGIELVHTHYDIQLSGQSEGEK